MQSFSAPGRSRIAFLADFTSVPYANLSFYDRARRSILFHLSLRFEDGIAVCNKRGPEDDSWGRESRRRIEFSAAKTSVEIRFDNPRIIVRINGEDVFSFGANPIGRRFPDLDQIRFLDYQGALVESSIDIDTAAPQSRKAGALDLTLRLELRGQLPPGSPTETLALDIPGLDLPPDLIVAPSEDGPRLRAILPGRVWQTVSADAPLIIRLVDGQKDIGAVSLDRTDLAERISQALEIGNPDGDALMAAQILEHARFGGVIPNLETETRDRLFALAAHYGLGEFLAEGHKPETDAPDVSPAPVPQSQTDLLNALAWVSRQLRGSDTAQDRADILENLQPGASDRTALFAALSEPFAERDEMDTLGAYARSQMSKPFQPAGDPWTNSGLLPFFALQKDYELVRDQLWTLKEETDHWLILPSLAWSVTRSISEDDIDDKLREEIAYAFADFIEKRAWDYWQRTPCHALIKATVSLIGQLDRFPDYARADFDAFAVRAYGLSPVFWTGIAELGIALPAKLGVARHAFSVLTGTGFTEAERADAFDVFARHNTADLWRIRRETFLPSGLAGADGDTATTTEFERRGIDTAEGSLRLMASPGSPSVGPDVRRVVHRWATSHYKEIDQAPYYTLQRQTSRRADELLAKAESGESVVAEAAAIVSDLLTLAGKRSHHVGLGLGISLVSGLLDAGAVEAAEGLGAAMAKCLSGDDTALASPATRMALTTLRNRQDELAIVALGGDPDDLPPKPTVDMVPGTSPLFDTVVVVFSCKPYLETRIPAMRDAWLDGLAKMGVPYLVVVGDGDGRIEDGIVHLDAPDDYEGLPQKTLSTIRWIHDNTAFTHMVKIDDDCFLNADEFFHSQSYRKFDYYGRKLHRARGQMDRAWHNTKSLSSRGRFELDKSPEPSSYCDGGSGYALSRTAMGAAIDAAASPEGRALIQISFMEDKLLGDLLSLRGIRPNNEDFNITVRRREAKGGLPVPKWVNGFDPSQDMPVKLVHLDRSEDQAVAARRLASPGLFPKKIWPTWQGAATGEQTNALELISTEDRLEGSRKAEVAVVACMRNEMFMLPHFLDHYRKLGVGAFLIADNCSDDGTLEYLAEEPDVAVFSVDTAYNRSHYGVAWQQALLAHYRQARWSLVADADELLVWQHPDKGAHPTLPALLSEPAFAKADSARIFMLDMYPGGSLSEADFASGDPFTEAGFTEKTPFLENSFVRGPYSNAPTWTSALRHRLIPGSRNELFVAQKVALLKYHPFMRLSAGLHYVAGVTLAPRELLFGHFKYNADFRRKAQTEVRRKQHFNDAEEYRKYLAVVSEGRDVIYDADLSVPWTNSSFASARLD